MTCTLHSQTYEAFRFYKRKKFIQVWNDKMTEGSFLGEQSLNNRNKFSYQPNVIPGRLAFSGLKRSSRPIFVSCSLRLKLSSTRKRGTCTETEVSFMACNQPTSFLRFMFATTLIGCSFVMQDYRRRSLRKTFCLLFIIDLLPTGLYHQKVK